MLGPGSGTAATGPSMWSCRPPGEHLALPGERWCDVAHRRDRYWRQVEALSDSQRAWTVDDAITENLDLPELLRDYLSRLSNAAECDTAFEVLRSLTVCDPTVGSGAFLFAALDILEPLYSEVLARAVELEARNEPVPPFLAEARSHPSSRYWLLKTICLHNLFGVDLMRDAPEIAKLRLFLKLAAQVDDVEHLEPLPDLDFNIKCGNLLVGIADADDARGRLFSHKLDHVTQLEQVEHTAQHIADAFDAYIAAETDDTGQLDHSNAKQDLNAELQAARSMADTLLHEMRDEDGDLDDWESSHQPFHWFVEFPSVWRQGGFDVIIGNPPYVKTSRVTSYRWLGYATQACPDLYAVCMERAATLLNSSGRVAMIVMHSLCFSNNYRVLRDHLVSEYNSLWVSSYSRNPGGLFSPSSDVRNTIFVGANSPKPLGMRTTRCWRWYVPFRPTLFDSIEYVHPADTLFTRGNTRSWPFTDNAPVHVAFTKMMQRQAPIASVLCKDSDFQLGYRTTALHMLGFHEEEPPTIDPKTNRQVTTKANRSGWMYFDNSLRRDLAFLALAGRWGFNWWLMLDDSFHVNKGVITQFPADIQRIEALSGDRGMVVKKLMGLASTLKTRMMENLEWKAHAKLLVGKYNLLKCIDTTDEADLLLAQLWGIEDAFEAAGNLRDRMVFGNKE